MKKITLIALLVFAFTSVASAAPLMDFEKGKVAIDYTFRPSLDFNATGEIKYQVNPPEGQPFGDSLSASRNFDGDANLDLGITFGIGNKWAIQYRQYNPTGTIWSPVLGDTDADYLAANFEGKIRSDEYNVLYNLNKNWNAFVGAVRYKGGIAASGSARFDNISGGLTIPELWSDDQDTVQFGVIGSYKIAKKTNLWGLASFGSDYRNWEAGLSYDIGKDVQFNVSYRDTKWSNMNFGSGHITMTGTDYVDDAPVTYTGSASAEINAKDVTVKGWGFGLTYKF